MWCSRELAHLFHVVFSRTKPSVPTTIPKHSARVINGTVVTFFAHRPIHQVNIRTSNSFHHSTNIIIRELFKNAPKAIQNWFTFFSQYTRPKQTTTETQLSSLPSPPNPLHCLSPTPIISSTQTDQTSPNFKITTPFTYPPPNQRSETTTHGSSNASAPKQTTSVPANPLPLHPPRNARLAPTAIPLPGRLPL